ncbi:MAG: helix-turn-helix domain-containing protein [Hyphomicrobiales bacterium]|nr:helix-turn-helix domain-containing protein [Hyphomicrobiales bacterium]MCP5001999.1 helix-turn-helix domain-containing protein [Hyphomicrobiales bacterium]
MLKENRSLGRGLIVLETLARQRAMSLSEIHRETGLPKSTLRRLLATLASRRFVRRSLSDKLYRVTVTLPDISISPVPPGLALVADIGLTHALVMTKKISWPSDIHIFEKHWMRIVESTRAVSPFSLYLGQVDRRLNLFGCATGAACLSQMDEERVRQLFDDPDKEYRFHPARFGITWTKLQHYLNKTREIGYGVRHPNYGGETVVNDKLSAIALPLRRDGEVCGGVSLLWPREFLSASEFADMYLDELAETVARIEADLDGFGDTNRKKGKAVKGRADPQPPAPTSRHRS